MPAIRKTLLQTRLPKVSRKSGRETNRLYRQNYGLTHNGIWDWGQSRLGFYYEKTDNTRMNEGSPAAARGVLPTTRRSPLTA
ncbi:outer membrane receptor FepA [Salmonella enterica subsp. enterica]|uniref:Outer membrane receptor FepA n=1 Tax=Salmonella enterica I TaxID=59201 RepID=A0A379WN86_SALET|nr:outer membrane receptor FepA [Salmonella enterica subsp. enterica]